MIEKLTDWNLRQEFQYQNLVEVVLLQEDSETYKEYVFRLSLPLNLVYWYSMEEDSEI